MTKLFVESLASNFNVALRLLEAALTDCPDNVWLRDLWPEEASTGPTSQGGLHGSAPWFLAYHVLLTLDYDLTAEFEPWEPPPPFDENTYAFPNRVFTKSELLRYIEYNRGKVERTLDDLTEDAVARLLPAAHRYHGMPYGVIVGGMSLHVVEHASQIRQFLADLGVKVQPMPGDRGYEGYLATDDGRGSFAGNAQSGTCLSESDTGEFNNLMASLLATVGNSESARPCLHSGTDNRAVLETGRHLSCETRIVPGVDDLHNVVDEVEERLPGGKITHVVRVGETVRRPGQPWSRDVHRLLAHLRERDFTLAPIPLGFDEYGREVLSYIAGNTSASVPSWPGPIWSDELLVDAGRTVAKYHRAVADFRPTELARWQYRPRALEAGEIICHHDFAVYNAVFQGTKIVGMIDWDVAGPGTVQEELAFLAWQWVPLGPPELKAKIGCDPGIDQIKRLRLLLDSYGYEDRSGLIDAVIDRIEVSRSGIEEHAEAGMPAWVALRAEGHTRDMELAIQYLESKNREFQSKIE